MSSEKLRKLLTLHEGRVEHAYQDSLGYWTIGVGHLIDKRKGGALPPHIIDALLDYDIEEHEKRLLAVAPWASTLDPVRYAVLVDMTFNLGSLAGWPIFLSQVKSGRWKAAANNMRSTKWATQVGKRAERLAAMMETGEWPAQL
jgi:lysozyme